MFRFFILFCGLIIISCYPKPKLEIIHDEFDGSITYLLENNILISDDPTHEIELNIQKTIDENNSYYLLIFECIGSTKIGLNDSTKTTFDIDGEKITIKPISIKTNKDFDPDLVLEIGNYKVDFGLIKNIAYGNEIRIKINGNRKILYSHLSLDNKINLQNFIESFIPIEEQTRFN